MLLKKILKKPSQILNSSKSKTTTQDHLKSSSKWELMPLTSSKIIMIRKFLTEDFSSKWEDNKNNWSKNGLVSVPLQETSEVQTNHIITEINNKEIENLKSKKLNKLNKVKQQLNNQKLKLNKLKLKPKLRLKVRNRSLMKLQRNKEKSFLNQTTIIIKNPNIKNQFITIMKRKLKLKWKKINLIMLLKKINITMLLKNQKVNKPLKNNKLIINQLKKKNTIMLLKSHKFKVKRRKPQKNKLKKRLNIMKKKNTKMMNGLSFHQLERIQREDDSYRNFFHENSFAYLNSLFKNILHFISSFSKEISKQILYDWKDFGL